MQGYDTLVDIMITDTPTDNVEHSNATLAAAIVSSVFGALLMVAIALAIWGMIRLYKQTRDTKPISK